MGEGGRGKERKGGKERKIYRSIKKEKNFCRAIKVSVES